MSAADKIAKLHQLVEKGALTPAEFEQTKARLRRLHFVGLRSPLDPRAS